MMILAIIQKQNNQNKNELTKGPLWPLYYVTIQLLPDGYRYANMGWPRKS